MLLCFLSVGLFFILKVAFLSEPSLNFKALIFRHSHRPESNLTFRILNEPLNTKSGVRNSHTTFAAIAQHSQYECIHRHRSGEC